MFNIRRFFDDLVGEMRSYVPTDGFTLLQLRFGTGYAHQHTENDAAAHVLYLYPIRIESSVRNDNLKLSLQATLYFDYRFASYDDSLQYHEFLQMVQDLFLFFRERFYEVVVDFVPENIEITAAKHVASFSFWVLIDPNLYP